MKIKILAIIVLTVLSSSCITMYLSGAMVIPNGYSKMAPDSPLYINDDTLKGIKTIRNSYFFGVDKAEPMEPMVVIEKNKKSLVIVFQYSGSQWIEFIDVIISSDGNEEMRFDLKSLAKRKQELSNGILKELVTTELTEMEENQFLSVIENSQSLNIQLKGDSYKDYLWGSEALSAINQIIDYYKDK